MKKKNKILKKVKLHCEKKAKEARKLAHTKPKAKNEKESETFQEEQVAAMEARRTRAIELFEQNRAVKKEKVGSNCVHCAIFLKVHSIYYII